MRRSLFLILFGFAVTTAFLSGSLRAQDLAWVQIEARPSLAQAQERARAYSERLPNVAGFRLSSGWYAIALGPYPPLVAETQLARLRARFEIPTDSFIADGRNFGQGFWPVGGIAAPVAPVPQEVAPAPLPAVVGDGETLAQSRAAERALGLDARREIQTSLQWAGFYASTIDGLFGPGTRRSIRAWQTAQGAEPTGVLTTAQRVALVGAYTEARESLGLRIISDARAGIEIEMPTALVAFERYEAPFVRFASKAGSGAEAYLISQTGDRATMSALFDVLQTLEIMPVDGPRQLNRRSFTLQGTNGKISSEAFVQLVPDGLKGFLLVWPAGDENRRRLTVEAMRASFRPIEGAVLPDTAGTLAAQRPDLVSGLRVRQPLFSRSGVYIDTRGRVLTAGSDLGACGRITVGDEIDAEIEATDAGLGAVLLLPQRRLAPLAVATLSATTPRLRTEIAVSGYSYGGLLGAPTVSFGTLADIRSLDGDARLDRLSVSVQPGDTGGPVLAPDGAMLGVLVSEVEGSGRALPADVHHQIDAAELAVFLSDAGVVPQVADQGPALAPEDLVIQAADMTVLVNCWE